jgi:hypothetical protein
MEKSVRDIQTEFVFKRAAKSPRLISRCLGTDENLAMLKCNHVGRSAQMQETAMQLRHAPIRNQDHAQITQVRRPLGVFPRKLETQPERTPRENLQRREFNAYCPLPVVQSDSERWTSCLVCRLHFTRAPHLSEMKSAERARQAAR